eukprot:5463773-Pleurochrysis_carterae.AAC.2
MDVHLRFFCAGGADGTFALCACACVRLRLCALPVVHLNAFGPGWMGGWLRGRAGVWVRTLG